MECWQHACVLEFFFCLGVYSTSSLVSSDEEWEFWASDSLLLSVFFLILFWHLTSVDYTWHSQTPNKTVHSDKADKSLDELFQYCALVWCCLSFRGLNQTAALWPCGLNQVGVKRQRNMTEHMWCFPLEACLSTESTLLNWFGAFIVFRLWCTFILHEFMWVFVLFFLQTTSIINESVEIVLSKPKLIAG